MKLPIICVICAGFFLFSCAGPRGEQAEGIAPEKIREVQVLQTVVGGKTVFDAS